MNDPKKVIIPFGDNKVHIYQRERSRAWQCYVHLDGEIHRTSSKQTNLAIAVTTAELFYIKHRLPQLLRQTGQSIAEFFGLDLQTGGPADQTDRRRKVTHSGPKFPDGVEVFRAEYAALTAGERSDDALEQHEGRIRAHLMPYFKDYYLSQLEEDDEITKFRQHRVNKAIERLGRAPARSTLDKDIITLRLILKASKRARLMKRLPDLSAPYHRSRKVKPRPWFSPEEYQKLYEATRERARNPKKERWRAEAEDLHDLVLFAGNTGLRPDEIARVQIRDVTVDAEEMKGTEILIIRVAEGKMGYGPCKSTPGAVEPFRRVLKRRNPKPEDLLFPNLHRELLNDVLKDTGLKVTRDGQMRTLGSLRHTYICMRLMEGAGYLNVARNCRTSPEMIESNYGYHILDYIDVDDLNVQRPRSRRQKAKARRIRDAEELG
jgi:integrase